MDAQPYIKAYNLIISANNILIVTQDHPDSDAAASACLLAEVAGLAGKKYRLYCANPINYQYEFLPRLDEFKNKLENFNFYFVGFKEVIKDFRGGGRGRVADFQIGVSFYFRVMIKFYYLLLRPPA